MSSGKTLAQVAHAAVMAADTERFQEWVADGCPGRVLAPSPRQFAASAARDDLAACVAAAQRLAKRARERLGADGVNLLNSCEEAAWQTVFHFHVHVIPRYHDDPLQLPGRPQEVEQDELAKVAEELRG
jgi:hypothetical protein